MKISPSKRPFQLNLGQRGEQAAADCLLRDHYEIVVKNYRCSLGEIDIVARKNKRLFFFEVKTRTSRRFGLPEEAVDERKRNKIKQVSQCYLKEHGLLEMPVSFGVAAIDVSEDGTMDVRIYDHAFSLDE